MSDLVQAIVSGLLLGGVFSIAAIGFSLIFGAMNILNLAHGVFVIAGAYGALIAWSVFGIDPFVALLPLMIIGCAVGWMLQRFIIRPTTRGGNQVTALLVTFGISLIAANIFNAIFSSAVRNISPAYAFVSLHFGGVQVDLVRALAFVAAIVLICIFSLFLRFTIWGQMIRATAQTELGARLCGLDADAVYAATFGVGSAFAVGAGVLIGMILPFTPADEVQWTVYAFVVVTLGGVGSPVGALLGGLLLGVAVTLTETFVGSVYANVVMFLILLLMLLLRPRGILGGGLRATL